MSDGARILVIDDEPQIRKLLEITLHSNGFDVVLAASAREGKLTCASRPPDLVLLDLGLPDGDGQQVLLELREWFTRPILIVSVRNSEDEIIRALDHGANDYLVKPFRTGELLARVRSALRSHLSEDKDPVIGNGDFEIDLSSRVVRKNGEPVKLTATEYALLALLARHEGTVLTHHYLLKEVWGPGYINQSQYLRVFVAQIRKKIENDPNRPEYLRTESGIGYRFTLRN